MPIKKVRRPAQKPGPSMKRFLDAAKVETVLLGPIERMLLAEVDEDRRQDIIHPSEMAKKDWCPRATYYRIVAVQDGKPWHREVNTFHQETIFAEGHEYHRKWQEWATQLGVLEGIWMCPSCGYKWWDRCPMACKRCNHVGQRVEGRTTNMVYREVPLRDPDCMVAGHSDGQAEDRLIEIKSIGLGTVRLEVPALVRQYTLKVTDDDGKERTVVDHDRLWKDVKRPFPSHLIQGWLYLELKARERDRMTDAQREQHAPVKEIVFLYEYKATSARKEFVIRSNRKAVEPLLELAADVAHAVKRRRPPDCAQGDEGCKHCTVYEKEHDGEGQADDGQRGRDEAAARDGAGDARAARLGDPERGSDDADRPAGRWADRAAGTADRVGGLRRRPARSG